jgi:hypothetical protein
MATPLAYSNYERLDLEICGRLPISEYLKYPLLGIFVLRRRALRAFEPADHVLHWHVPLLSMCFVLSYIIKGAVSTASGNATAGNSTAEAIKGLVTAQVGIDKNMTGNELQQAMDLIVCMPTTMKQMSKAQHNMTGSMKDGMMMK